jgi:hypothetical protein
VPSPAASSRRIAGWFLLWALAAAVAVTVGVLAVTTAGAGIRDRGPIGDNELIRQADLSVPPSVDSTLEPVRREIAEEFGVFVVECRGSLASAVEARPAAGWRVISYESGPDDDVDAVFASAGRSVDVEVFCNRGVPTVSDLEVHSRP